MVKELETKADFDKFLQDNNDKLAVIDFTAKWCGPCKKISPKFEEMSKEFTAVAFGKVDVDENEEVSEQEHIHAMPTFVFYKNGERMVGKEITGANEQKLRSQIQANK